MHRILLSCTCLWLLAAIGVGAERKFPYDAVVNVEEEYVRSGNGRNYYPTSKLHRGDRVAVHRHDPGGWVMISPPPGSFSWIRADHVRKTAGAAGVVQQNGVIVRVGSQFNDDHDFYQRELSKGDRVQVLGEKTFETDHGPVKMLKIEPPPNEFRWIMGKALLPTDAPVRKPLTPADVVSEPKDVPNETPEAFEDDPFGDGPFSKKTEPQEPQARPEPIDSPATQSTRRTDPDADQLEEMRTRLTAIDDQFRSMIKEDPPTWDLVSLEQQYRQLETAADLPAFQTQVKLRLDAVERYTRLKREYEEFERVTKETRQRDAQLMSLTNASNGPSAIATAPVTEPPSRAKPAPAKLPTTYDGAGIIRRSSSGIRGAPVFVLMTPGGRLLAYLQPAPGVDLSPYVGQAMGVIGQRSYRQELQGEMIVVRSLQPVRLKSGT